MKHVINDLRARLKDATTKAFGEQVQGVEPGIDNASNPAFGDFQSNVALTLSKQLKQQPRQIAEQIVGKLEVDGICETPTIAGPGFINIKLKPAFLEREINRLRSDERLGVPLPASVKSVIVDMSSPNIAKEMHVGHLRSTIIGDSLARTYEFLGHKVLKLNHVGDWGTQFGMLICELKDQYPAALQHPEALDLGDLNNFYKQAKKHFDDDPEFQERARLQVVALQSGDAESVAAWKLLCDQSRKHFDDIYGILGVQNLVERGESFYNDMLADTVAALERKGLAVENDGAKCVFLDGYKTSEGKPLPLIVQKKDGGYNYATTDLASIRYRVDHEKANELIYVVDAGQSLHFEMMTKVARLAGFVPDNVYVEHVPFGLVLGEDGKKLKTRSGETVRLQDLIDEAIEHARAELDRRQMDPEIDKEQLSKAIAIGAIKYADLSLNRITNYVFSYDKMLSLQGNTAPYMMYAYVRVQGIARAGGIDFDKLDDVSVTLAQPTEVELAKHLLRLDDILESVIQDKMPNRICEFLFELSQKFNQFYEACQVLNAEEPTRTSRLILCDLTARTIRHGLTLLGIPIVERM